MSKKYNFPSLAGTKRTAQPSQDDDDQAKKSKSSSTMARLSETHRSVGRPRKESAPTRNKKIKEESPDSESEEEASEEENLRPRGSSKKKPAEDEDDDEDDEAMGEDYDEDDMEMQLDEEDGGTLMKKRLPELDFILSFAHKRARDMLNSREDEDRPLQIVIATWLNELQGRFDTFQKQAAKFDEYESALLQSQRMHQKIRKQIGDLLRQKREINRKLADVKSLNERRKLGAREEASAQTMLTAIAASRLS